MLEKKIQKAKELVKEANALIICAGAGMGVDSGLPDFRGNEGFWKAYPPMKNLGISFSQMANPDWFERKPDLAWGFYGHRLNLYRETKPHSGFTSLLDYAKKLANNYFVFTSNVDGQFQNAGFDKEKIYEIHGSIHNLQCTTPCNNDIWPVGKALIEVDKTSFLAKGEIPMCEKCGLLARPNILMFGDWGWIDNISNQQSRRLNNWLNQQDNSKLKLLIIEIGAGKAVPSVRMFSERIVRNHNASLIRLNPRDFDVPTGEIGISIGALEGINLIFD